MKRDLVIGVDCCTTASTAIVWDAGGASLAEGRCPSHRATGQCLSANLSAEI